MVMHPNDYNLTRLRTLDEIKSAISSSKDEYVAIDTETTGLFWPKGDRAFGVALAWDDQYVFIRNSENSKENIGRFLTDIYALDHKVIVFHNAEFDIHMIRETYGVGPLPNRIIDTFRLSYLQNTSADHSLKGWSSQVFGSGVTIGEDIIKEWRKRYKVKDYSMIPSSILDPYACMDVALTKSLAEQYNQSVKDISPRWYEYEHMLIPIIVQMAKDGIKIDLDYVEQESSRIKREQYEVHREIFKIVGKGISIGSTQDLNKYFYKRMGVVFSPEDNIENEESTDVNSLKAIMEKRDKYPDAAQVAELVLKWRGLDKRRGTYLEAYIEHNVNGYIHAALNASGTRTGRFSSSNPNIQNIPRGKNIRKIFIPAEGTLYEFDYSQLEYRLAGISAEEPVVVLAYQQGIDFHSIVASNIFNKPVSMITTEERFVGKTINFLSLYGGGAKRLMVELNSNQDFDINIDLYRATDFLNDYWAQLPELEKFNKKLIEDAQRYGFVYTRLGRKVHISDRYYAAPNYCIQGTGGDMIKLSLIRVAKLLQGTGAVMRNTVHDSILIDNLEPDLIPEIRRAMESFKYESPILGQMPISVGVKECPENWGEGYEWKIDELAAGKRLYYD